MNEKPDIQGTSNFTAELQKPRFKPWLKLLSAVVCFAFIVTQLEWGWAQEGAAKFPVVASGISGGVAAEGDYSYAKPDRPMPVSVNALRELLRSKAREVHNKELEKRRREYEMEWAAEESKFRNAQNIERSNFEFSQVLQQILQSIKLAQAFTAGAASAAPGLGYFNYIRTANSISYFHNGREGLPDRIRKKNLVTGEVTEDLIERFRDGPFKYLPMRIFRTINNPFDGVSQVVLEFFEYLAGSTPFGRQENGTPGAHTPTHWRTTTQHPEGYTTVQNFFGRYNAEYLLSELFSVLQDSRFPLLLVLSHIFGIVHGNDLNRNITEQWKNTIRVGFKDQKALAVALKAAFAFKAPSFENAYKVPTYISNPLVALLEPTLVYMYNMTYTDVPDGNSVNSVRNGFERDVWDKYNHPDINPKGKPTHESYSATIDPRTGLLMASTIVSTHPSGSVATTAIQNSWRVGFGLARQIITRSRRNAQGELEGPVKRIVRNIKANDFARRPTQESIFQESNGKKHNRISNLQGSIGSKHRRTANIGGKTVYLGPNSSIKSQITRDSAAPSILQINVSFNTKPDAFGRQTHPATISLKLDTQKLDPAVVARVETLFQDEDFLKGLEKKLLSSDPDAWGRIHAYIKEKAPLDTELLNQIELGQNFDKALKALTKLFEKDPSLGSSLQGLIQKHPDVVTNLINNDNSVLSRFARTNPDFLKLLAQNPSVVKRLELAGPIPVLAEFLSRFQTFDSLAFTGEEEKEAFTNWHSRNPAASQEEIEKYLEDHQAAILSLNIAKPEVIQAILNEPKYADMITHIFLSDPTFFEDLMKDPAWSSRMISLMVANPFLIQNLFKDNPKTDPTSGKDNPGGAALINWLTAHPNAAGQLDAVQAINDKIAGNEARIKSLQTDLDKWAAKNFADFPNPADKIRSSVEKTIGAALPDLVVNVQDRENLAFNLVGDVTDSISVFSQSGKKGFALEQMPVKDFNPYGRPEDFNLIKSQVGIEGLHTIKANVVHQEYFKDTEIATLDEKVSVSAHSPGKIEFRAITRTLNALLQILLEKSRGREIGVDRNARIAYVPFESVDETQTLAFDKEGRAGVQKITSTNGFGQTSEGMRYITELPKELPTDKLGIDLKVLKDKIGYGSNGQPRGFIEFFKLFDAFFRLTGSFWRVLIGIITDILGRQLGFESTTARFNSEGLFIGREISNLVKTILDAFGRVINQLFYGIDQDGNQTTELVERGYDERNRQKRTYQARFDIQGEVQSQERLIDSFDEFDRAAIERVLPFSSTGPSDIRKFTKIGYNSLGQATSRRGSSENFQDIPLLDVKPSEEYDRLKDPKKARSINLRSLYWLGRNSYAKKFSGPYFDVGSYSGRAAWDERIFYGANGQAIKTTLSNGETSQGGTFEGETRNFFDKDDNLISKVQTATQDFADGSQAWIRADTANYYVDGLLDHSLRLVQQVYQTTIQTQKVKPQVQANGPMSESSQKTETVSERIRVERTDKTEGKFTYDDQKRRIGANIHRKVWEEEYKIKEDSQNKRELSLLPQWVRDLRALNRPKPELVSSRWITEDTAVNSTIVDGLVKKTHLVQTLRDSTGYLKITSDATHRYDADGEYAGSDTTTHRQGNVNGQVINNERKRSFNVVEKNKYRQPVKRKYASHGPHPDENEGWIQVDTYDDDGTHRRTAVKRERLFGEDGPKPGDWLRDQVEFSAFDLNGNITNSQTSSLSMTHQPAKRSWEPIELGTFKPTPGGIPREASAFPWPMRYYSGFDINAYNQSVYQRFMRDYKQNKDGFFQTADGRRVLIPKKGGGFAILQTAGEEPKQILIKAGVIGSDEILYYNPASSTYWARAPTGDKLILIGYEASDKKLFIVDSSQQALLQVYDREQGLLRAPTDIEKSKYITKEEKVRQHDPVYEQNLLGQWQPIDYHVDHTTKYSEPFPTLDWEVGRRGRARMTPRFELTSSGHARTHHIKYDLAGRVIDQTTTSSGTTRYADGHVDSPPGSTSAAYGQRYNRFEDLISQQLINLGRTIMFGSQNFYVNEKTGKREGSRTFQQGRDGRTRIKQEMRLDADGRTTYLGVRAKKHRNVMESVVWGVIMVVFAIILNVIGVHIVIATLMTSFAGTHVNAKTNGGKFTYKAWAVAFVVSLVLRVGWNVAGGGGDIGTEAPAAGEAVGLIVSDAAVAALLEYVGDKWSTFLRVLAAALVGYAVSGLASSLADSTLTNGNTYAADQANGGEQAGKAKTTSEQAEKTAAKSRSFSDNLERAVNKATLAQTLASGLLRAASSYLANKAMERKLKKYEWDDSHKADRKLENYELIFGESARLAGGLLGQLLGAMAEFEIGNKNKYGEYVQETARGDRAFYGSAWNLLIGRAKYWKDKKGNLIVSNVKVTDKRLRQAMEEGKYNPDDAYTFVFSPSGQVHVYDKKGRLVLFKFFLENGKARWVVIEKPQPAPKGKPIPERKPIYAVDSDGTEYWRNDDGYLKAIKGPRKLGTIKVKDQKTGKYVEKPIHRVRVLLSGGSDIGLCLASEKDKSDLKKLGFTLKKGQNIYYHAPTAVLSKKEGEGHVVMAWRVSVTETVKYKFEIPAGIKFTAVITELTEKEQKEIIFRFDTQPKKGKDALPVPEITAVLEDGKVYKPKNGVWPKPVKELMAKYRNAHEMVKKWDQAVKKGDQKEIKRLHMEYGGLSGWGKQYVDALQAPWVLNQGLNLSFKAPKINYKTNMTYRTFKTQNYRSGGRNEWRRNK